MLLQNVIAAFTSALLHPKPVNNSGDPRYSCQFLIAPDHPQLGEVYDQFEAVKNAAFPSGLSHRADICLMEYDIKYQGKDYYDARCSGWWVLTCNAKIDSKPSVVMATADGGIEPLIDPGQVYSGMLCDVHFGMFSFTQGNTGVAAGLNGVRIHGVEGALGRLDNKPSVEQMFGVTLNNKPQRPAGGPPARPGAPATGGAPARPGAPATGGAPARPGAPAAPQRTLPPKLPPKKQMTAKAVAEGYTYDDLVAAHWTDQDMIDNGYLVPPTVRPSFN